jgi:3-deoxy-D-manno-octulosonate 8-phosphate phosphatase (KDO 8-P phosphatase)
MRLVNDPSELRNMAGRIKLLLMDCDGVLTDGRLYFSASGEELKVFDVRDGQGIVSWHKAGFRSGIISGRDAGKIIERRVEELGMHFRRVRSENKVKDLQQIIAETRLSPRETAYIGDDVGDIAVMKEVGLAIAVADAVEEARVVAHFVTKACGGRGAVREVTDLLLTSQD